MEKAAIQVRASEAQLKIGTKKSAITRLSKEIAKDLVPRCQPEQNPDEAVKVRVKEALDDIRAAKIQFNELADELDGLYSWVPTLRRTLCCNKADNQDVGIRRTLCWNKADTMLE